jgi:hypothetical protein
MPETVRRADSFRYVGYGIDVAQNKLLCAYQLDDLDFREEITFPGGGDWDSPAVGEAARLVFLLAAVSYYKAGAPPVIDLGETAVTDKERTFLREFYIEGLGEFAYRQQPRLDLSDIRIIGPSLGRTAPVAFEADEGRPLVPFGGGMDSIVTVELLKPRAKEPALFVVNRPGDRYAAIEQAVAVTGLPVVRAERLIDDKLLRSRELGFLNGHVPITGILSAIAVMAAALEHRDAVIMSNEWSASSGTIEVAGRVLNHQYSKSQSFEGELRSIVGDALGGVPSYFSLLRPFSELWIARQLQQYPQYFDHFRSCNRAFYSDPAKRWDRWCGECDKCCFIDLILAPFVAESDLRRIFQNAEPLANPSLVGTFRTLLGLVRDSKPWECVGDVTECRAAVRMASARQDRAGSPVLTGLVAELGKQADGFSLEALLRPLGRHFVEERYAPDDLLV